MYWFCVNCSGLPEAMFGNTVSERAFDGETGVVSALNLAPNGMVTGIEATAVGTALYISGAFGPDGDLYAGGIGSTGDWGQAGKQRFGLQKLSFNGKVPFEMLAVRPGTGGVHPQGTPCAGRRPRPPLLLLGLVICHCRPRIGLRRPGAILNLLRLVLTDIVRSNVAVSRIILGPRPAALTSGFALVQPILDADTIVSGFFDFGSLFELATTSGDLSEEDVAAAEQRLLLEHARTTHCGGHYPTADAGAA